MNYFKPWLMPWLMIGALCFAFLSSAQAGGMQSLQNFLRDVKTLRADFTQTVVDARVKVPEEARGTFQLSRPGKFRWDYHTPYHQVIVADGKKVWFYDPDLEQVTVKALDAALGSTPAQLLASFEPLEKTFNITSTGNKDGLDWVELTPKDKEGGFERVRLGFAQDLLREMELADNFGQTTRLEFEKIERNPAIPATVFQFTPPPGVDVIGE